MPFTEVSIKEEIENKRNTSPEFNKAWEESREEYRLINEIVSLRKKERMTQGRLAELTGNRQQVISRIEKKENIPSIGTFSRILDALGYELRIVKKGAD